ncbi:MAG: tRNA-dihydrouridine synthase, partial [Alphaproteobacteria bacterium]|nr:tRNA-dihydrouridine synthase [Alphaproteobacteria bacterium]
DGVMLGRAAYQNPYLLAEVDGRYFGATTPPPTRHEVVDRLLPYIEAELSAGTPLKAMTRHLMGLFRDMPGARYWRRTLSENAYRPGVGPELLRDTLRQMPPPTQADAA